MKNFIGSRLKMARENANLKQVDVKNKTVISNKNLSNWETGIAQPSIQDAIILADLYGITLDELFGHKSKNIHSVITQELSTLEKRFILKMRTLNDKGQQKALDYIDDLVGNPKYTEKENIISA